jgi:alkylhydroperoxidase/carboxymuconolactone decarboxylase family protein YurZ
MLEKQRNAFNVFYDSARYSGVLDDKTSLMVHLSAAMATGCYPCMHFYLDQIDKVGLSDDEISAIEAIVMAVSAGKVREQFSEVLSGKGTSEDCSCTD